jgi:hypothetical protein
MRLKLEPWPPDYGTSAFDMAGDEDGGIANSAQPRIDLGKEFEHWAPIQPSQGRYQGFERLFFVDGSRRIEQFLFAEGVRDGQYRVLPGLLGTFAVGLAQAERSGSAACRVVHTRIERRLILGGDYHTDDVIIPASDNQLGVLRYQATSISQADNREGFLQLQLQNLMRQGEAKLANSLMDLARDQLLIVDGPLPRDQLSIPTLGYVKTLHDLWIPPTEQRTLFALQAGQRTPIFYIEDNYKPRWSWFLRLATGEPWYQSLAGVVRLEYSPLERHNTLDEVVRVADWSCLELPRYAAASFRDPRAPQQLMPVAFLEAELARRMGSLPIIRRRIRSYFRQLELNQAQSPTDPAPPRS